MKDSEILELITTNLKSNDKHIIIRDENNNIVFPKDIEAIRDIERLTSSIEASSEFKDKETGNNYVIKSNSCYFNEKQYTFYMIENNNRFKKIEEKMKHDEATKVFNKDSILGIIDNYILDKDNDLDYLSITVCDIDYFKKINDTYSHLAGDEVLKMVAEVFRSFSEKNKDFKVGRFGGDEFVFVIKNMNSDEAFKLVENIKKTVESIEVEFNGKKISITMSFGIYTISDLYDFKFDSLNDIIEKRKELFSCADEALYESKRNGRNRISTFKKVNTDIIDFEEITEKKFRVI